MSKVTLGRTGITVEKNAFGALPLQRVGIDEAVYLLQKAQDSGFEYFDTARSYTDSEEKLGAAFGGSRRDKIFIATKTHSSTGEGVRADLEESLRMLKTDHIDVYQFHNTPFCPVPGGEDGMYDEAMKAKKEGKILHLGITNHRLSVAREAIESGLYETLQFPFSYLAGPQEEELVRLCADKNIGFVCMKGLAGGLITDAEAAYAFMMQHENALPIWGIQRESELDEFISLIGSEGKMTDRIRALIEKDRGELSGDFCRGCGYCMPCPVGIKISECARRSLLMRRAPLEASLTPQVKEEMEMIEKCLHCGSCASKCPYDLDTPELLQRNYEDYKNVLSGKTVIK
ncbi:MAG: aldo/keto reductase [Anaerovoracaceae bacterium]|jgi:aryl-alcohol dehydrogenase-like predicted oxidoreductase